MIIVILGLIFTKESYAYLDPGSGSYLLQLLIGVLLGGLFALKLFWGRVITFLKSLLFRKRKDERPKD
ncbi:MAG: hypothetical protein ISS34_04605 [Candidatus Omnitrophica bacterium]|nr:hypothetical protein [Candidatus Omnitrophota bacterium]